MTAYRVLLRGINVGGKNKVPMAELRSLLEDLGFETVSTYIASGNAFLDSDLSASKVAEKIEAALPKAFTLDSDLVKVRVLSAAELEAVVKNRPTGFGDEPSKYHSDAIFLMGIDAGEAIAVFNPREGVDTVWPGNGVVYSQRLSAERAKSRLNQMMPSPLYKFIWSGAPTRNMPLIGPDSDRDPAGIAPAKGQSCHTSTSPSLRR